MAEREYIVTLHKGVDADQFNQDMIASTGAGAIPNRTVDIANARPKSIRNTHYSLTDDEAESLRNDSRVMAVEIPPEDRDDIVLIRRATNVGVFDKTTSDSGNFVNWGLRRSNDLTNLYTGNTAPGSYNYTLEGTGVDVVIQDSGIQFAHEEWNDPSGVQRLRRINWFTEAQLAGTQPGGFYSDYDGHGTHVAGIVAGKTYGWGKNADIYTMKLQGLEGPTDPGAGIPISSSFDLIKGWHQNKTSGRPTVVNMSWGYVSYYTQIVGGNYRGTPWTGNSRQPLYGMVEAYDGVGFAFPVRVPSVDADIDEMIDAGINVVIAAGNTFHKIDINGGADYDNYFLRSSAPATPVYYHRGGSPYSDRAVIVGNLDSEEYGGGLEQKASSSEHGPGVDLYAPGTNIMSASSNASIYQQGAYSFGNAFWKQMNISGTSMAAPQVAGAMCLYLQLNPTADPERVKRFIIENAQEDLLYTTLSDTEYGDFRSLNGGNNRILFNQYNSPNQLELQYSGSTTFSLSPDDENTTEGDTVTFTLTTTNVTDGTTVPYTISGISAEDIDIPLTGNFTVNSNTATVDITLAEDLLTEGTETLVIELDNGKAIAGVTVQDTSVGLPAPVYNLISSNYSPDEGDTFTITLQTQNVLNGETFDYTITGIDSADINGASLTGTFTITNGSDSVTFTVTADETTEADETMRLSLDGGKDSISLIINDTSKTPAYSLSADVDPVPEGDAVTITLTTENIADGVNVPFTITGVTSADINNQSLTGNFTIESDTAQLVILATPDLTTEGLETLTLSIDGTPESITIDISDTSPNRPAGTNRNITVTSGYNLTGTDATGAISGTNIDVNLDYGDTVIFDINVPGDPFVIKTVQEIGTEDEVSGIINNGGTSGTISWRPNRIGTFYYQSSLNVGVGGQIIVS
jgi:subtilisin family serine protease